MYVFIIMYLYILEVSFLLLLVQAFVVKQRLITIKQFCILLFVLGLAVRTNYCIYCVEPGNNPTLCINWGCLCFSSCCLCCCAVSPLLQVTGECLHVREEQWILWWKKHICIFSLNSGIEFKRWQAASPFWNVDLIGHQLKWLLS